jgi:hypothetical protein
MVLRRLFPVLVVGGGALVATGCGGDTAVRPTHEQQQVLPDGGVVTPSPMPGGGGSTGGGGGGGPMGW